MQTTVRNTAATHLSIADGECLFAKDPGYRLVGRGIRCSVAVAVHIPRLGMGVLLRFLHPDSAGDPAMANTNPYLFADTALSACLSGLRQHGISNPDFRIHAVGASVTGEDADSRGSGKANELALKKVLWREKLWLASEDLGGDLARSIWFEPATGRLIVRSEKDRSAAPARELRYAV